MANLIYYITKCNILFKFSKRDLTKLVQKHSYHVMPLSKIKPLLQLRNCNEKQSCYVLHKGGNGIFGTQYRTFKTSCSFLQHDWQSAKNKSILTSMYYMAALGVLVVGLAYAAVPLYRIFCQAYSYGGVVQQKEAGEKVANMTPINERKITINFNADTAAAMTWSFRPQQTKIDLVPGETALAFYTAKNPTDRQVIGVSTYNVIPFEAGQYFNKIQCFCFDEQMLNPKEEVHMPVMFYIDPEFADDPAMDNVKDITLSYTFFEAKPGMEIPLPGFMRKQRATQTT